MNITNQNQGQASGNSDAYDNRNNPRTAPTKDARLASRGDMRKKKSNPEEKRLQPMTLATTPGDVSDRQHQRNNVLQTPPKETPKTTETAGQRRRFDQITDTPESAMETDTTRPPRKSEARRWEETHDWDDDDPDETARNLNFDVNDIDPTPTSTYHKTNANDHDADTSMTTDDMILPLANNKIQHE